MRIIVDRELCEANAVCTRIAPAFFRINDQDQLEIVHEQPDTTQRAIVEKAVRMCPRGALSLKES